MSHISKKRIKLLIFIITLTFSIMIYLFRGQISQFTKFGYIGIFVAMFLSSATILFPIPGALLVVASGSFLNPLILGVVSALGETLGEMIGYTLGRSGRHLLIENDNQYQRLKNLMHHYGLLPVFILAAIPNPLFDIVGIASGILHFSVLKFLVAVYCGKFIKNITFAKLGGLL